MQNDPELEIQRHILAGMERQLVALDVTENRELFQSGLADMVCRVRTYASKPGHKEVKVLSTRINPGRAAMRALANYGRWHVMYVTLN